MRALASLSLILIPALAMLAALTGADAAPDNRTGTAVPVANVAAPSTAAFDGDDDDDDDDATVRLTRRFVRDPLSDPSAVIAGQAEARLRWNAFDAPAFDGDRPGSLTARYDSGLEPGLFGYRLPRPLTEQDPFTAATVFSIDPATFAADPNGFFQISWGLWNTRTTGLNRSGDLTSFAADSFELLEFDWFPNASDFFGGPFLSPTAFGVATGAAPDAFANATFVFDLEAALPLGVPLLATLEHRPADDALITQVYRIVEGGRAVPVNGAVAVNRLDGMPLRAYELDAVGLTLWQDGFGGPTPAVVADLTFHSIVVRPRAPIAPGKLF